MAVVQDDENNRNLSQGDYASDETFKGIAKALKCSNSVQNLHLMYAK